MSSKLVSIYLNGNQITVKKLNLNEKLSNIRSLLSDKIDDSYIFTLDSGDKIGLSDESDISLEDILIDGKKIFMTAEKIIKKNIPIEGSKLIGNIGKLKNI